jgi:hypothetical protein
MFDLLRRAPVTTAGRRGRVILRLEGLEVRATPSGDGTASIVPPPVQYGAGQGNQPPIIDGLMVRSIGGGWYVVSGRVFDESPGGLVVQFGGSVASLSGRSVTTQADGTFTLNVQLRTDGSDTGWLLATTQDAQGLESNEASCYVSP